MLESLQAEEQLWAVPHLKAVGSTWGQKGEADAGLTWVTLDLRADQSTAAAWLALSPRAPEQAQGEGRRRVLAARGCQGSGVPRGPLPNERRTPLAVLLRAQLSRELSLWDWSPLAQGTKAVPRKSSSSPPELHGSILS